MILDLKKHISKLPELKAVSFDLFDTLITRSVANPEGVFLKLGHKLNDQGIISCSPSAFDHMRYVCEKRARYNSSREEITLREVYEEMAYANSLESSIERLMELELETERESLFPITHMVEQVRIARKAFGKAVFISDMYLPTAFIRDILGKLGIFETGDSLYVSSQHFAQKGSGKLFKIVLEELNLLPQELLHAGNSQEYDIDPAVAIGINTFYFSAGNKGRSEKILAKHGDDTDGFADYIAGAARISRLNAPPALGEKEQALWQTGSTVTGPFLYLYACWILQRAKHLKISKLAFLARDAYFIKTVCDDILKRGNYPEIETVYLYGSRQTYKYLGISTLDNNAWQAIFGSKKPKSTSLKEIAGELHCSENELSERLSSAGIKAPSTGGLGSDIVGQIKEAILCPGELNRWVLKQIQIGIDTQAEYLRQEKVLGARNLALVDAGWTTRSHAPLFNFLVENGSDDLRLFYTALIVEQDKLKIDSERIDAFMFDRANKKGKIQHRGDIYYPRALETLLVSRHGRTIGFERRDGTIGPVLASKSNPDLCNESIDIYEKAIDQFATFAAEHSTDPSPVFDTRLLAKEIMSEFWKHPDEAESRLWSGLSWEWDPSGKVQYPLARPYRISDLWNAFSVHDYPRCYPQFWIGGAKMITPDSTLRLIVFAIKLRGIYSRALRIIPKGPQNLIRKTVAKLKDPNHKLRY